jgi:hypothetical protein
VILEVCGCTRRDETGRQLAKRRLPEAVTGLEALHGLVADHLGDQDAAADVVVGIETDRGPWVQALVAAGYTVYAVNPPAGCALPGAAPALRSEVMRPVEPNQFRPEPIPIQAGQRWPVERSHAWLTATASCAA